MLLLGRGWAQPVDKQKLETNDYHRVFENCHISSSMTPRGLKLSRERTYTIIDHRIDLFFSRSN